MKKNLLVVFALLVLLSFNSKKDNPFIAIDLKKIEKSFALIPGGSLSYFPENNIGKRGIKDASIEKSIDTFYMSNHEVTNREYLEFLEELRQKNKEIYLKMLPDTLVWRTQMFYSDPIVEFYLRHPAYRDYPVVGVSYEQAEYFCKWLTDKYLNYKNRKHLNVEFKLPTKDQWLYAFIGGKMQRPFPWMGFSLQDKTGKWLANFHFVAQSSISQSDSTNEIFVNKTTQECIHYKLSPDYFPMPVVSFVPNEFGLYNMAGNVSEYIRNENISKGGGWNSVGYYLTFYAEEKFDSINSTSNNRGFRVAMEIKK